MTLALFKKSGQQIRDELGLPSNYNVMLQRIINHPAMIYIITYNSKFPTVSLTTGKIRSNKALQIKRPKKSLFGISLKNYRITPAIDIDYVTPSITSQTLFIVYDMAGEYLRASELKESTNSNKCKVVLYKDLED